MAARPIEDSVLQCLDENYGLHGSLKRLAGENLNYLLTSSEGVRHVVKIVDEEMPPEVVEMEFEAMEYANSAGFQLKLPRIIPNIFGNIETGINIHIYGSYRLRILGFINGIVLETMSDISSILMKNVAISLAEYHLAMRGFDHAAARRSHRWNLVEAGQHRDRISLLEDPEKRDLLTWGFDAWGQTESKLNSLPWQFIHGDMNHENILVMGDRVAGLVDFGDCCMNPTVCDLAICLTYMMMDRGDPWATAAIVTRAYHEIRPLTEAELSVLLPLVCGRLATTIAISTARRSIDPHNPNWFGIEDSAWGLLTVLQEMTGVDQTGFQTSSRLVSS